MKKISLESHELFERSLTVADNTALIGYSNNGVKYIAKIDVDCTARDDMVDPLQLQNMDMIELGVYPKNLMIMEFEQFNNDVISAIAWESSLPRERIFRLFFEVIITPESLIEVPYLGGIEDDKSKCHDTGGIASDGQLFETKGVIDHFCWTKTHQACGSGILGARLSVTSRKKREGVNEASLIIYQHEHLKQCMIRSTECTQKIDLNYAGTYPCNLSHISAESLSNMSIQFVPWENQKIHCNIMDSDNDSDRSVLYTRNFIISIGTQIYLYDLSISPQQSNSESGLPWKANCHMLFCHDAHKTAIVHVLPYSSRLPNLFFSAESGKKLHAWHWQRNTEKRQEEEQY